MVDIRMKRCRTSLGAVLEEGKWDTVDFMDAGRQITSGLHYLHTRALVHRDLKPENILMDDSSSEGPRYLFADFGLSKMLAQSRQTVGVGTPGYYAPGIMGLCPGGHGFAADVFSLSVAFIVMLDYVTLDGLWRTYVGWRVCNQTITNFHKLLRRFAASLIKPHVACSLIAEMLSIKPTYRPSTAKILGHINHEIIPVDSLIPP